MHRNVSRLLTLAIVIGVAWGGFAWYRGRQVDAATPVFRTEAASRGPVSEIVTTTGSVSAVTTVQVGSQVSGIISRLNADFNSRVTRGQLLAELDPTPFLTQVEQRQADLTRVMVQARASEIDLRRQERLLGEGLTAEAEFDAAKAAHDAALAQVDQSKAALAQAQTNLTYTRILSPIDGVVVARQYDVGQTVAASFQAPTLFTIAQDLTKMQVQADVDQADIGKIRVGQHARFTVDAYSDTEFEGEISQIRLNATANQNVITYPVILAVPNPEGKLRPMMTANVTIVIATIEDALRVPNAALRFRPVVRAGDGTGEATNRFSRGGPQAAAEALTAGSAPRAKRGQTVYVLENGAPKVVPVRTGITDGRFTVIVDDGLAPEAQVITGLATIKVEGGGDFPGSAGGMGGGRGRRPM